MGGAVLVCSALALEIEVEAALEVEVRGGLDEVVDDSIVACSWGRWRCPKLTGLYLADHGVEREAVETGLNLADHGVERDAVETGLYLADHGVKRDAVEGPPANRTVGFNMWKSDWLPSKSQ